MMKSQSMGFSQISARNQNGQKIERFFCKKKSANAHLGMETNGGVAARRRRVRTGCTTEGKGEELVPEADAGGSLGREASTHGWFGGRRQVNRRRLQQGCGGKTPPRGSEPRGSVSTVCLSAKEWILKLLGKRLHAPCASGNMYHYITFEYFGLIAYLVNRQVNRRLNRRRLQ